MATFRICKYIYLHKNMPTAQGLVSSGIDRDASEWTKYPHSPLQLSIDTTPTGGAKISLKYENTSVEHLDIDEIDERFGSIYGTNNPPLVASCKQPGIGFKYLVKRFHTMQYPDAMSLFPLTQTYRFQIKVSYMDDYDRTVEMQSKTGVCIKGRPSKSTTTEDATQTSFKDFNPKFRWNGESDDDDLTQIDAFLMSQTL